MGLKELKLFIVLFSFANFCHAQSNPQSDSLIQSLMKNHVTPGDEGVKLINAGNFESASSFLTKEISANESNASAYFKRGVANFAMSDTLEACRDWSAVLALGDTAMFNLLESKCHSSMIIENDTIPSKKYKKMWGKEDANAASKLVVDEMPQFPGGQEKLAEYIFTNTPKHTNGKHGTVYVNFLISPKGKILFPYVKRGIGKEYDAEALKLIRSMPAWKPGKEKGKTVYVRSAVPVRF